MSAYSTKSSNMNKIKSDSMVLHLPPDGGAQLLNKMVSQNLDF